MKVILTQAVPGLGDAGTIKEVADGYARNYLLPRKMAIAATKSSVKQVEQMAEQFARKADKARSEVEKAAGAVEGKVVRIRARAGSENRLYGSVTGGDLSDALQAQYGLAIDRRRIEVEPIHRLGTYTATADMGSGVSATFNVEVLPEVAGAHGKTGAAAGEAPSETSSEAPPEAEAPAEEEEALEETEASPS